ncbi:hypothetical protein [Hymenobacter elongatus]|uniref:hypothetical protein n=1 Tax=Hymenobacter elongatus TaxID=877208 RepID=UPI001436C076|nr:hypothetical protein [Hymenobacter elongatus]
MPELILAGVLGALFLLPLLTAYMAHTNGRRFWPWFLVGVRITLRVAFRRDARGTPRP